MTRLAISRTCEGYRRTQTQHQCPEISSPHWLPRHSWSPPVKRHANAVRHHVWLTPHPPPAHARCDPAGTPRDVSLTVRLSRRKATRFLDRELKSSQVRDSRCRNDLADQARSGWNGDVVGNDRALDGHPCLDVHPRPKHALDDVRAIRDPASPPKNDLWTDARVTCHRSLYT